MQVLDSIKESLIVRKAVSAGQWGASWLKDQLWPVYSTGAVIGALCLLASLHEKTILADHLYGATSPMRDQQEQIVKTGAQVMDEEASKAVKSYVWGLPADEFRKLRANRNMDIL
eukprot:PhF_6_TR19789/c0_g1_i1/m.28854